MAPYKIVVFVFVFAALGSRLQALEPINRPINGMWINFKVNYLKLCDVADSIKKMPGLSEMPEAASRLATIRNMRKDFDEQIIPSIDYLLKSPRGHQEELKSRFEQAADDLNAIVDASNQAVILFVANGGHLDRDLLIKLSWWWDHKNMYYNAFEADLHLGL